jgi:hypothetical protein
MYSFLVVQFALDQPPNEPISKLIDGPLIRLVAFADCLAHDL